MAEFGDSGAAHSGGATNPFDDARLLYERAQKHIAEFNGAFGPRSATPVWRIKHSLDAASGEHLYSLALDRTVLRLLKPVAADVANNLLHALDQILAACGRLNGRDRNFNLGYPISGTDEKFEENMSRISAYVGGRFSDEFRRIRGTYRHSLPHLQALREVSHAGKHWMLSPPAALLHAVAYSERPGPQRFFDVPQGHFARCDSLTLMRSAQSLNGPFELAVNLRFMGLSIDLAADPGTIFNLGSNYVLDAIESCERIA